MPLKRLRSSTAVLFLACVPGPALALADEGLGLLEVVQLTLERQPEIKVARQQLELAGGTLEASRGVFDLQLSSQVSADRQELPLGSLDQAPGRDEARTDALHWDVGASKLFSSGLSLAPAVTVTQVDADASPLVDSRSALSLTLVQPLLRGRGASVVKGPVRAAGLERDARAFDLRHATSLSVLRTVAAYWNYKARARQVEIARESEARFARMEAISQKLLEAREVAAVDIRQLSAILSLRRVSRLEAEQALLEARQALALAAGLGAPEMLALGPPRDDFPAGAAVAGDLRAHVEAALARRADLQGARLREEGAGVQVRVAEDGFRPQLDVVASAGWAGLAERPGLGGLLDPLRRNLAGPSASGGLAFSWAPSRRAARGALAESRALAAQAAISVADLERTIPAQVALALEVLERAAQRVETARQARDLYAEVVEAERQRLQLGISSVIDVINTEDRLTEAELQHVSAQADHAVAVARLRFETDTLLAGTRTEPEIDPAALTTPPPL